jgi:hypothetical protein
MPFSDEFADVYQIGIKEACESAGAYCERVDEQIFVETMLQRIYNQISKADFIVADMTGRNPNVFYEVGYAHALGKRTILLTKSAADIPFDLKHFPHIVYGEKLTVLREELSKRVAWHIANPLSTDSDSRIEIDLYSEGVALGDGIFVAKFCDGKVPYFPLTIHNRSSQTYEPGSFKIGVVVPKPFSNLTMHDTSRTALPDGRKLLMFPIFDTLFPDAYDSCAVGIDYGHKSTFAIGDEFPFQIRVFTPAGTRDFPGTIRYVDKSEVPDKDYFE